MSVADSAEVLSFTVENDKAIAALLSDPRWSKALPQPSITWPPISAEATDGSPEQLATSRILNMMCMLSHGDPHLYTREELQPFGGREFAAAVVREYMKLAEAWLTNGVGQTRALREQVQHRLAELVEQVHPGFLKLQQYPLPAVVEWYPRQTADGETHWSPTRETEAIM